MAGWHKTSRHERGYGAEWVKTSARIRARDKYLCQACLREGRLTPYRKGIGFAVDHIRPKAKGGTDDDGNLELLCKACHADKTRKDSLRRRTVGVDGWSTGPKRFGYSIPDDVRPSAIPVVLVCGPPASGKSHWIKQRATDADTVIDFDECRKKVGGRKWDARKEIKRAAFALRDQMIHQLANKTEGIAYLIVTAPKQEEREAWRAALGDVSIVVIRTPADECIRRIKSDPDRAEAASVQIGAVKDWWAVN